jgi:aspartyl aminopeptidase
VANTLHAEIALISLLVMTLVVEITVVGAMSILLTKMVLPVRDALISVMIHGTAVTNTTLTSALLDGNVMKNLDNANQTWLEKVTAPTLPVPNTAIHIQHQKNQIHSNAILQLIHATNAPRTILQEVAQKVEKRLVKTAKLHQRASGSATRLTQQTQNVKNAKVQRRMIQIARADNKLAKAATNLKRCTIATRKN